ncbi:dihydrofolate reductase [Sporothrix schenckii 1099-18]|uniref:Dihydrofolate reductase n=1 Tax=Sporothrix schenckii 1099-18 TaxID=1397361 RepID=A0A0F2M8X1_SPOSC|nr:dihydrofolate reductase [Sporothrix schenckii 1099-18]KJR86082.1 dihydrofolate reductase [Sporothrix schenckii 1099-18]
MASQPHPQANRPPKPAAVPKRDVKILMLHGFTQSGNLFRAKTRALEKMLQKSLAPFHLSPVLLYPTGPNRLQPRDLPGYEPPEDGSVENDEDDTSDSWAWWRRDDATQEYRFLNEGMTHLAKYIAEAGGVDGVLGFSQGGAAAAIVASALEDRPAPEGAEWSWVEALRAANGHRAVRFAVIYSGFFASPENLRWLYEPAITTPSLHFIGGLDTVVDETRTQALVDRCIEPVALTHPGGHYVPINKEWVMPLVSFVKTHSENNEGSTVTDSKI